MATRYYATKKGFTVMEVLVVAGIFLIMFMALAPFVQMAKARSNRINCANNLRKISLALHAYAAEHDDAFPPNLETLYPKYIETQSVYDCPVSKAVGTSQKTDYVYIAGLTEASSPREIIVEDIEGNHKGAGRNVLRIDGSVEWVSGKR